MLLKGVFYEMEQYKADFVVCGGGLSGICAAVAAARHGLNVALIHDRPVLGGNCSSEIGISINGAAYNGGSASVYAREGGIVEEIKMKLLCHENNRDIVFFEIVYEEPNINLFLNTLITGVETENSRIKAVTCHQLASERQFRFEAPLFADTTGDGFVGYTAGAEFMQGREARSQFGEPLAPETADGYTLGDTLVFETTDTGRPSRFTRPSFAYDITKMPFFKNIGADKGLHRDIRRGPNGQIGGFWWLEYGGQLDTIYDNEDIALELRKLVYGMWDYIKNSGDFPDVETLKLARVAPIPGKRESRRFVGDHILTQSDVDNKVDFPDSVAISGWPMDVHAPKGIYDDGHATHWHFVAGMFHLPFSMMYSKNISNLMFAGRNMSATHVAFGSTRVACQGGVAGQAIGTAAALCKKYDMTPRQIRDQHFDELLTILLDEDQTIIGRREPMHPALSDVTLTASSVKSFENVNTKGMILLDKEYVLALPIATGRIDSFQVKLKNFSADPQSLQVELYGGFRPENYIPEFFIKSIEVPVAGGFNGWITLPAGCDDLPDGKLYVLFRPNSNLRLYANNDKLTGAVSFTTGEIDCTSTAKYKGLKRLFRLRAGKQPYTQICFTNVEPEQPVYQVENLLNGYSRPYGLPNLWMSATNTPGEFVELTFPNPTPIGELQLIFNTALEEDSVRPELFIDGVKRYTLRLTLADGSVETERIGRCCQRVAKHRLDKTVKSIKIIFEETYGSKYFELFAIKIKAD